MTKTQIIRNYDFDFYDVQCEDGSRERREWTYEEALEAAREASNETGLWYEVHGVMVLSRVTP